MQGVAPLLMFGLWSQGNLAKLGQDQNGFVAGAPPNVFPKIGVPLNHPF